MSHSRAEEFARLFHDTYERLASDFGYETRRDSAVPWEQVPAPNRQLMIAVVTAVAGPVLDALTEAERDRDVARAERDKAREDCGHQRHIAGFLSDEVSKWIRLKTKADERIAELEAENERLRAAVRHLWSDYRGHDEWEGDATCICAKCEDVRAALDQKEQP